MALVLGIDPGLDGALAVIGDGYFEVYDMPTFNMTVGKKTRKRIDLVELANMVDGFAVLGLDLAVLEAVGGRPKQSASAGFVFGYTVGAVAMALMNARIPLETVTPQVWKKIMKLPGKIPPKGAEKNAAIQQIKVRGDELFPHYRERFLGARGGVKTDRIEAAALAEFGRRHVLKAIRPDGEWRLAYKDADTGA